MDRIFVLWTLSSPCVKFFSREIVLAIPDINLHDAMTHGLLRMERPSSLIHFPRVVEKTDVRQNRPEPVVRVRQIVLKCDSAAQFSNGFEMLKVLRRSPQQEGIGNMRFGQIRIQLQRASAMK